VPHDISLLTTVAAGLGLAFVLGLAAARFSLPPILGYLVAGVMVGPFTPGFVADRGLAGQLAEIGVMLLMFGVGLHFSIPDLLKVRRIAVPGAIVQITVATLLGAVMARLWGWTWGSGVVFGLSLSVASTVVLLRALEDRGIVESVHGRIAVGWLIVEDLVTVLALVLLPALAEVLGADPVAGAHSANGGGSIAVTIALTIAKVAGFVAVMLIGGRRIVPWILSRVVRTGSRELFTLAVLAIALGIAVGAAALFDVSFALGAFFAGIVVSESDFSHEAAANALPLQDAFAVLFFVSVGMLFDPMILVSQPLQVLSVLAIILLGKSLAAFGIVLLFRHSVHTALTISASLAQIGEFSFILAALGVSLGLLPVTAQSLIVAGALLSITLNPLTFGAVEPLSRWVTDRRRREKAVERPLAPISELPAEVPEASLVDHVVIVGAGRVGEPVARELRIHGIPHVIIEASREVSERLRGQGFPVIYGDATRLDVLGRAHLERARLVIVAAPDAYAARSMLARAHQLNPGVEVVIRTHSDAEREFLEEMGAAQALVAERELAVSLTREALQRFPLAVDMADVASRMLRGRSTLPPESGSAQADGSLANDSTTKG
jgi:monovalent cation:H+ antiporter-2, CPA2 family